MWLFVNIWVLLHICSYCWTNIILFEFFEQIWFHSKFWANLILFRILNKFGQNFEKIWFYSEFWTNSDKILKKSDFIQNSEQIWAKFWKKLFFNVLNYSKVLMKQSFQYFLLMKSSINCNILLFSQSKDRNFAQNNNFIYLKFIQNIFGFENI